MSSFAVDSKFFGMRLTYCLLSSYDSTLVGRTGTGTSYMMRFAQKGKSINVTGNAATKRGNKRVTSNLCFDRDFQG